MKSERAWTTPEDARAELQRLWDRGRLLSAELSGEPLFPLSLRFRRPDSRTLLERFDEVVPWIRSLEANARPAIGAGYELEWAEVVHRQLGRNRVPAALIVQSRLDALRWLGKVRQAERFETLAKATLEPFPELREWLLKKPLMVLERADAWERILAVLAWFRAHPRAGVYVRQIDVRGVDTKFIELHRALLIELLNIVLPSETIDASARNFEPRYGLLSKPALVRFRSLDPDLRFGGLSDISTPIREFAAISPPVRRVFITENELNGLVFPNVPQSIVVFGLGYGVELLRDVPWLSEQDVRYWGDIDTHGFAMLDRLRAFLPRASSFLMDLETLEEHRLQWVEEAVPHLTPLSRLTQREMALYDGLIANRFGNRVRLEQERIGVHWLECALRAT